MSKGIPLGKSAFSPYFDHMPSHSRPALLVCSLLLVAIQFLVYAPALENAFVRYDDDTYVYKNAMIKAIDAETLSTMFSRPYFRSYAPLVLVSHAVDYALWNENPWGHHLTSLILHSANVVLMFVLTLVLLSRSMARSEPGARTSFLQTVTGKTIVGAFIAALLFSLHPMRVESVAWISDRKDLLVALFLLLTVLAYLKYDESRGNRGAVTWLSFALAFNILALLSKSIATVTPLLLISLDGLLLHRRANRSEWKRLILEKIPFFLLSVLFGLLALWAAPGTSTNNIVGMMTTGQRMLLPFYTIAFYPAKILFPIGLSPVYAPISTLWMVAGSLLAFILTAACLWKAHKGQMVWLLALLGYLLPLLPTISGLTAGIQPWADRYSYVPSIALFMLVGGGASVLWNRSNTLLRSMTLAMAAVAAICFVSLDRQQIAIWKDSESLWRAVVRESPTVPNGFDNLGITIADKGDLDGALEMYRTAIRLQPEFADPYYNAGVAFQAKGVNDSANIYYRQAIAADQNLVDAYINLGNIQANEGNRPEAIGMYQHALAVDGRNADAYYNLGCVDYQIGDKDNALDCFRKATTISPNYANAYYNMGIIYLERKDMEPALGSFVRAAQLGSAEAREKLKKSGYTWK